MNAIILAAGNSTRMQKDGYDTPKPLLPILGVPNIERTVLMLHEFGITDITILCKSEDLGRYKFLEERYQCDLVHSSLHYNTLFSMSLVLDKLNDTFVIEGDVVLAKNIFRYSKKSFYYTMRYIESEVDAWQPLLENGRITGFKIGPSTFPCIFGISFWARQDCLSLQSILKAFYTLEYFENDSLFWDDAIVTELDRLDIGTYEILPIDAAEMNTGREYLSAQEICKRYYQNCRQLMLDYRAAAKLYPQCADLIFVEDMDSCRQWQRRLLEHVDIRLSEAPGTVPTTTFHENEYPFMVRDQATGAYVAYFDIAESPDYVLLRRLFVDESYRRQKIGSEIVSYTKLYASLTNKEMRVNVYEKAVEQFYIGLGMELYFKTFRFCGGRGS